MHFNPDKKLPNDINEQNGSEFSSELDITLQINGTIIPEVQETKFLGEIIYNKFSWIPSHVAHSAPLCGTSIAA